MKRRTFIATAAAASAGFAGPISAQAHELVLDGDFASGQVVSLDDEALSEFPQRLIETRTIWTSGLQQFSGPSLADVLEHFGAGPGDLILGAINDYSVAVNRSLITSAAPIIANRIDGLPFSPRQKGPFWIIFPYDSSAEFRTEIIYAASVWQLSSITVLKD
ncbi:MAG: oxidoreductase [Octadecabacter sp.]